jgi:hypothetical protein
VSPYPDDEDEPWMWKVFEVADETTEYQVDVGGAANLEAAKSAADLIAAAYRNRTLR